MIHLADSASHTHTFPLSVGFFLVQPLVLWSPGHSGHLKVWVGEGGQVLRRPLSISSLAVDQQHTDERVFKKKKQKKHVFKKKKKKKTPKKMSRSFFVFAFCLSDCESNFNCLGVCCRHRCRHRCVYVCGAGCCEFTR